MKEITYTRIGDYYYPNLILPKGRYDNVRFGYYGRLKLNYLREKKRGFLKLLEMKGTLHDYLVEVDIQAKKRENYIMNQMIKKQNITEELKQKEQLKWVGLVNNIKNCAREIVKNELIFD